MRPTLVAFVLSTLFLAGCGESEESTPAEETPVETSSPSATAEAAEEPGEEATTAEPPPAGTDDDALEIEIEITGDDVRPRGEHVEVGVGKEVVLAVESDRSAELHVHSSPEQLLEVMPGESTLTLTIDKPGVVDVEEHDTGTVVLRLEVR